MPINIGSSEEGSVDNKMIGPSQFHDSFLLTGHGNIKGPKGSRELYLCVKFFTREQNSEEHQGVKEEQ